MFSSYWRIAWRNLFRHKGFTLTNLFGLTIGISCSLLIFLWVHDEVTYDQFHVNHENIYQVIANRDFKNHVFTDRNMAFPLALAINKGSEPQIKYAVQMTYSEDHIFGTGADRVKKRGYTVSEHFFDIFTWKFLRGTPANAIADPNSIVLSASAAKAFFGNQDPIGKVLKIDDDYNAKVTAVVADAPGNSSFSFDFVRLFRYAAMQRDLEEWGHASWNTFIQTTPNANMTQVTAYVNQVMHDHNSHDKISSFFTFPMNKWRLYSDFKDGKNAGGMIEYVRLFSIIALIILLIACINFMNLSTARSERRAREVGIRKTLGSHKGQLIGQFMIESSLLSLIAFACSLLLVYLLLPAFNSMVDKQLSIHFNDPVFWTGVAAIIVFTGTVAGSYPAFYLSSFNPVRVLKGSVQAGRGAMIPRRILVITQFVISILLISATIIVYKQLQYVKNRDLGYDPNNLIMFNQTDKLSRDYPSLRDDILKTGMIESVTRSLSPMTDIWWKSGAPEWPGRPANTDIVFSGQSTDIDYAKTIGLKFIQGHDFTGTAADSGYMILNQSAIDAMQLKNPIGTRMRYGNRDFTVIGITENMVMETPYKPVDPLMTYFQPYNTSIITVRLKNGASPQKAIAALEPVFKGHDPSLMFSYDFVDQQFGKKFMTEELVSKITDIFAALAIVICCIGLAGLASFTIEKRIREIGIRKVLGASVAQVLELISREFLKLVTLAFLIAVPLTWWLMNEWLNKYTFRIRISPWVFVGVGGVILLLTALVVALNTVRAATRNPVKSLRSE